MEKQKKRWKTIWVSDLHMGSIACNAARFMDFLRTNDAETWYLVGDIIDGWELKRSMANWKGVHNDIIQKLLRKARKGSRIVYIVGNHDEFLYPFVGLHFGNIEIKEQEIYVSVNGFKIMVIHGHQFDVFVGKYRWIGKIGGFLHHWLLKIGHVSNVVRKLVGLDRRSLSSVIKRRTKHVMGYISNYENILTNWAKEMDCDGIVCGHIHHGVIREKDRFTYMNDGDWQEGASCLAEGYDGKIELLEFGQES